jgi:hypothetical protein
MPYRPNPLAKFRLRQISVLVASACVSPILFAQSLTPPFIFVGSPSVPESFKTGMAPQNFNKDGTFTLEDRGISGVFAYAGDPLVEYSQQNPANFYFLDPMYGVPGKIMEVFCSSKPDRSDAAKLKSGVTASNRVEWQETSYSPQFDSRGYEQSGLGSIDQCYSSPIAMREGTGAWKYDPQPYAFSAKDITYWTVTRNPDGTGSAVTSNFATIKPLFRQKLLNRSDKIKPSVLDSETKHYQSFVAPSSGRFKIGSIVNPNSTYGIGTRVLATGAKFGTVDVVGSDIFYTPGPSFGVAENVNADEFITVTAYNSVPYVGSQTPSDLLPMTTSVSAVYQLTPYSQAQQGNAVFRLVNTTTGLQSNVDFPGAPVVWTGDLGNEIASSRRNVFSFSPVVSEPSFDIYHTPPTDQNIYWDPSLVNMQSLYVLQTAGAPCPILYRDGNGDPYATIKQYLKYQPEVATACVIEDQSASVPNNAFYVERAYNSSNSDYEFKSNEYFHFTAQRDGKGTVQVKVSEIDRNGNVVKTQTLKYERTLAYPDYFDYTLANNFVVINGYHVVTDRTKDIANVVWNTTDLSNLGTTGNLKIAPSTPTFGIDTGVVQEFYDKRAVKQIVEPGNTISLMGFNLTKESIPVSAGNRKSDGTITVTFGGAAVTGDYTAKLMRLSASTSLVSEVELPATAWKFCVGSQGPVATDLAGGCQSTVTLPKDLVNSVNAAEDRLFLQFEAILGRSNALATQFETLRADDSYNEYFVRKFSIPGFEGNVLLPDATLVVPHPGLRGKPMEASLSNRRNIARVTWTLKSANPGFQTVVTTRRNASPLDLNGLQPGTYSVQADMYNEGDDLVRTKDTFFAVYQYPNVIMKTPTKGTVGRSYTLSADVSNVPAVAVPRFQVGYDIIPATLSADGKKITATYIPAQISESSKVSLSIQLDPADEFSYINFTAADMAIDAPPLGFLETKANVFWVAKGEAIKFVGDSAAKRIDWLVTRPDNQVATTATPNTNAFNTQGLTEGVNLVAAKVYNDVGESYTTEQMTVAVYKQPKATFNISNVAPANQTINLVAKTSNVPLNAIVTWRVGDEILPAQPTASGEIISSYKMPAIGGSYPVALVVQVDPDNPYAVATFNGPKLSSVAYGKVSVSMSVPKLLDVGEESLYKATIKPSWDTKVLPMTGDGLAGEWELPDGTRVPGLNLRWTPTVADYDRYLAGKKPIFRAWLQGAEESTTNTVQTTVSMLEPWVMPSYSLIPKSGTTSVIAPATVVLRLTPSRSVLSSVLKLRGVKYEWNIPQSPNITTKVTNDIAVVDIKGEGSFPFAVRTFDRYGTEVTSTINIEAVNSTLSMTKMQFSPSPQNGRVPVTVGLKVATQSTHQKERIVRYIASVNGEIAYDAKSVKPVILTEPGDHEITVKAISNYGSEASLTSTFTATPNNPPQCSLFKVSHGKTGSVSVVRAVPTCRDYDGKLKKFQWSVNGVPNTNSLQVQSYTFGPGETSVTIAVSVTDDSGATTTYEETINKQ